MSEREEHLEAFSEEFEEESVANRPSQSWREVDQDPSPSSSDSEDSMIHFLLLAFSTALSSNQSAQLERRATIKRVNHESG